MTPPAPSALAAVPRLLLFALSSAAALGIGFLLVTPPQAEWLIRQGGYYYMLALFAGFVACVLRIARPRREVWQGWLRRPGGTAAVLLAATLFVLWSDTYQHKVLFDEYVLQATGFHLHATKEVGTVIRAYQFDGTWLPIDTYLDKRPYFFTFLLSLVHDLTGYRIANIFVLNSLLAASTRICWNTSSSNWLPDMAWFHLPCYCSTTRHPEQFASTPAYRRARRGSSRC